jgi:hypothetical protein
VLAVLGLLGVGLLPVWPGALHLVALPPLDLVADIGALLSRTSHPAAFVVGAAVSLVVRSAILAALLGRFDRDGLWFALRFYLAVWPGALLAASLLHGAHAVLFYALVWFGLAVTVVMFAASAAVPWVGEPTVRTSWAGALRSWLRLGTLGAYLVVLVLLGLVAALGPDPLVVLLVPVSAAWTWLAARWLLADPGWVVPRRAVGALVPVSLGALVFIVATGPAAPPEPDGAESRDGSLLLMSGIDSSSGSGAILEIDPRWLGFDCGQTYYFSYAGPGDGQPQNDARCPIDHGAPYEPEDTMRSRDELVDFVAAFVEEMEPPHLVIAHSQAAWVTWEAAAAGRLGDDVTVVLLGAFPESPVGYVPGARGVATDPGRLALLPVAELPRPGGGTSAFDPDSPLGREWLADTEAVEEVFSRPLPEGVQAVSVPSMFDLPLKPGGPELPGAVDACPLTTIHPNLPFDPELGRAITAYLDGESLPGCTWWRQVLGPATQGFTVAPG